MKTLKIVQLILLLLIISGLVVVLAFGMAGRLTGTIGTWFRHSVVSSSVMIFDHAYDGRDLIRIDSQLNTSNLEFEVSADDQLRVVYYGPESEKDDPTVRVHFASDTVEITQKNRIGFLRSFSNERVIVYLPRSFAADIACQSASGNILFNEDLTLNHLRLEVSSGNVTMQAITTSVLDIDVSSGRVLADWVQADVYRFKISSGNLQLIGLIGKGDIISTSGNITVEALTGGGSIKSTSGNTTIGLEKLDTDLEISLTSGSADVQLLMSDPDLSCDLDVLSGTIRSNFGNVNRHVAGASLSHAFGDGTGHHLSVKSTSGNLKIEQLNND